MKLNLFIQLAGLAQITLALGSLAIPGVLRWKAELAKTNVLIKQMFWVYAAYIFVINLCFGLVSFFGSRELTNATTLGRLLTGFIAVYWISRMTIQFFILDRSNFPKGKWHLAAEVVLTTVFVFLRTVYGVAFYVELA